MTIDQTFVTRPGWWAPVVCGCGMAACAVGVAAVDPGQIGLLTCPFRALTGWWCPGCGLTRATHHVLRGNLLEALRYNPLVIVVLAVIAGSWATWLSEATGRTVPGWRRVPTSVWIGLAVGAVVLGVARNLPGLESLRP